MFVCLSLFMSSSIFGFRFRQNSPILTKRLYDVKEQSTKRMKEKKSDVLYILNPELCDEKKEKKTKRNSHCTGNYVFFIFMLKN